MVNLALESFFDASLFAHLPLIINMWLRMSCFLAFCFGTPLAVCCALYGAFLARRQLPKPYVVRLSAHELNAACESRGMRLVVGVLELDYKLELPRAVVVAAVAAMKHAPVNSVVHRLVVDHMNGEFTYALEPDAKSD